MTPQQLALQALDLSGTKLSKDTFHGKNIVRVDTTARAVYDLWLNGDKLAGERYKTNATHLTKALSDDDDRPTFAGATVQTVKTAFDDGQFNTDIFKKAQEKARGLIQIDTLDTLAGKRRTRFLSEHDGEYDFDRQYDLAPFSATRIERGGAVRTLNIDVEFTFNAGVRHRDIAEYGALAWSIVDIVEKAGIQVNLRLALPCDMGHETIVDESHPLNKTGTVVKYIELKKAGDYIETMGLARCFTPWYFRRCLFSLMTIVSQARGRDTEYGLGRCINKPSSATLGNLYIGTEAIGGAEHDIEAIAGFLKKALGIELETEK